MNKETKYFRIGYFSKPFKHSGVDRLAIAVKFDLKFIFTVNKVNIFIVEFHSFGAMFSFCLTIMLYHIISGMDSVNPISITIVNNNQTC